MAKETTKKGKGAPAGRQGRARGPQKQKGPVCPGDLNLPRLSREEYVADVLEQVEEFEEKLAELESDLESAGWDDVDDYRGEIDDLRLQLRAAREKSEEVETAADSAWPSLYEEMEQTLLQLAGRVDDLTAELGRVLPE